MGLQIALSPIGYGFASLSAPTQSAPDWSNLLFRVVLGAGAANEC